MSKNAISLKQVQLACRHVNQLKKAGVTVNLGIRTLELFVDVYAQYLLRGSVSPHHVSKCDLWSKAAQRALKANPTKSPGTFLRVEHGTPRRELARLVLAAHENGKLSKQRLDRLCKSKWKLAVITHEEDNRLNKIARAKRYGTPEKRWAAARIKF